MLVYTLVCSEVNKLGVVSTLRRMKLVKLSPKTDIIRKRLENSDQNTLLDREQSTLVNGVEDSEMVTVHKFGKTQLFIKVNGRRTEPMAKANLHM